MIYRQHSEEKKVVENDKEVDSIKVLLTILLVSRLASPPVFAAEPKTYQVTGPVLEVKDDVITVQKETEKWEIGRDKDAKVTGDLKASPRVTVHYRMKATGIEIQNDVKKAPPKTETKK